MLAVSYGPFATAMHGFPVPSEAVIDRDFALMGQLGANFVRTFTVPPRWFLDLTSAERLRVHVTIPWLEYTCFLDDKATIQQTRGIVRAAAQSLGGHPALFGMLLGNEIPPDIVRWHGPDKVAAFLRSLGDEVKQAAPQTLLSYANFPSTEYLDLADFLDFVSFNVYLHREPDFRRYLSRLHNLAGDRPLVLTEFGIDSI